MIVSVIDWGIEDSEVVAMTIRWNICAARSPIQGPVKSEDAICGLPSTPAVGTSFKMIYHDV